MSLLWDRSWRVQVGAIASTTVDCTFKIEKTIGAKPNTCELSIFNLTEANRKEIEKSPRGTVVQIDAGYADSRGLVFRGDLRRAISKRAEADWISEVTAGDGEHTIHVARASRSFNNDATVGDVATYLAGAMALGTGNLAEMLRGRTMDQIGNTFPEGAVVHGRASAELTRLLASCGLTWSVQDGVLQVMERGGSLNRTAILLSSDTGLTGSPSVGANRIVSVTVLLIQDLVPGQRVQLRSRTVNGLYRIEKSVIEGDTRSDDSWGTTLDLRRVT